MDNKLERIIQFVSKEYYTAVEDGATELKLTITILPSRENFEVEKKGLIHKEKKE